jgi:uncharacterized protein YbcV (DUF1398 family)
MTTSDAIRKAVHEADKAANYPEALRILLQAGVRVYHTDVKSRTIFYSSDHDCYADHGEAPVPDDAKPTGVFDIEGIRDAKRAIDDGKTDYTGFLREIWRAGVVEYDVSLMGRRIVYCGAHGESHVEHLPDFEAP